MPAVNTADREKFDKQFPYNANAAKPATSEDHLSSDEILQQWASSDQIIRPASPLILRNQDDAWDTSRDLLQALQLTPADPSKGVFNLYEATLGSNSMLINMADAVTTRTMKLNFSSVVTGEEELDTAERICWFIPKGYTMIQPPEQDKLGTNQLLITAESQLTSIFTEKEWDVYNKYKDEYYCIVDTSIANPDAEETPRESRRVEATLDYYISPNFIKHWTHNKIRASAYRYQRTYEAEYDLQFGAKGTNGTGYTLMLSMAEETKKDGTKVSNPPAWTRSGANTDTASIKLEALLFDPDEKDITSQAKFTWSVYVPIAIGMYSWPSGLWQLSQYMDNVNTATPTMKDFVTDRGWILKCQAAIGNSEKVFTGYLTIPMRTNRDIIGMVGPTLVRYNSSGTNPQFYDGALGLIDSQENIQYNYSVKTITIEEGYVKGNDGQGSNGSVDIATDGRTNNGTGWKDYFPVVQNNKGDARSHLKPKAMFFKDINKKKYPSNADKAQVYNVGYEFIQNNSCVWANPILILMDPYGNQMLNNWGGELNIDYDNNSIMSAVMGAGRKENDNTFTGLLMGDLPKVDNTGLTGTDATDPTK